MNIPLLGQSNGPGGAALPPQFFPLAQTVAQGQVWAQGGLSRATGVALVVLQRFLTEDLVRGVLSGNEASINRLRLAVAAAVQTAHALLAAADKPSAPDAPSSAPASPGEAPGG